MVQALTRRDFACRLAWPCATLPPMLLKIIAFLSAAIPIFLFLRSLLARRPSRVGTALREAKKQIDLGVTIFLAIIACIAAFALGRLAWTWWTAV